MQQYIVLQEVVENAKRIMDKDFISNAIKPGDSSYIYDKRVDFTPSEDASNEWDDEE